MSNIRVLIVEDEPIVAAGLRHMLQKLDFDVTAIVGDMEAALYTLEHHRPDIALLDINLDGAFEGLEIGRAIRDKYHIPFVYLTAHADRRTVDRAKQTEPSGYIVKPFDEGDVLANLEIAMYNYSLKQKALFKSPDWKSINQQLPEPLSRREIDVLKLIFKGKTNAMMAQDLFISVNTVKRHLLHLYQKLGARSRTEALSRLRELVQK